MKIATFLGAAAVAGMMLAGTPVMAQMNDPAPMAGDEAMPARPMMRHHGMMKHHRMKMMHHKKMMMHHKRMMMRHHMKTM